MNYCKQCSRKGGCGCLWYSKDLCKKCHHTAAQTTLPPDLKAEFEIHDAQTTHTTQTK